VLPSDNNEVDKDVPASWTSEARQETRENNSQVSEIGMIFSSEQ
jgi:hypothetical protein